MIITGAPIELLEFEEVDYWDELCAIMECQRQIFIQHYIFVGHKRHFTIILA